MKRMLTPRPKAVDILDHSPELIEGLRFSTQEFYQRLEAALQIRQVPELQVTHVDFKEGGPLTPRREYLRCRRERLLYDICAMPFGTGFFVSEWFWEKRHRLGLAALLVAIAISGLVFTVITGPYNEVYFWLWRHIGHRLGLALHQMTWIVAGVPLAVAILAAVWFGERLDGMLIRVPLIGYLYERFWRRITYYRADRTSAFRAAIHAAVSEVVNEICQSQGIVARSELAQGAVHKDLRAMTDSPKRARPRQVFG